MPAGDLRRPAYQPPPGLFHSVSVAYLPLTQEVSLDFARHTRDDVRIGIATPTGQYRQSPRAQRNPLLLLRLPGSLLLRFAQRKFLGLSLFQEPPRKTGFVAHPFEKTSSPRSRSRKWYVSPWAAWATHACTERVMCSADTRPVS